jgi:hypothetical protein
LCFNYYEMNSLKEIANCKSLFVVICMLFFTSGSCYSQAWEIVYEPIPSMGRDINGLDITDLPSSIYILKVLTDKGAILEKVVKY